MAPAAASTIKQFLEDTGTKPDDYDLILTGDLGQIGSDLLYDLLGRENIDISGHHADCGLLIYDREKQDVHAGGSGCGCGFRPCSYILSRVRDGRLKHALYRHRSSPEPHQRTAGTVHPPVLPIWAYLPYKVR